MKKLDGSGKSKIDAASYTQDPTKRSPKLNGSKSKQLGARTKSVKQENKHLVQRRHACL